MKYKMSYFQTCGVERNIVELEFSKRSNAKARESANKRIAAWNRWAGWRNSSWQFSLINLLSPAGRVIR